jgi:hypothetical protein
MGVGSSDELSCFSLVGEDEDAFSPVWCADVAGS